MYAFAARGSVSAVCLVLAVAVAPASSAELARYREFTLGSSVATVTAVTRNAERVKTVHRRPALLQELEWRPRYMPGPPQADRDSIGEVVFSFIDDKLFRMSIAYVQQRTSGLTNEDMVDSLTAVYGTPSSTSLRPPTPPRAVAWDAPVILAEWRHADTAAVLQRKPHTEAFFLVITSLTLDTLAEKARIAAVAMDEREAPAREAALQKKRADDAKAEADTIRSTNKKAFRP
jgi:hypothetical protein